MIYAPVLITTLNRYECLKKCIVSLQKNNWAEKTELFISVDYPPSYKYIEGYCKIRDYLSTNIKGFKKVHIFFHDKNLGSINNAEWIRKMVCEKHDRYIFLEDDNELAPCFLEFCDKGLEIFEEDESIIAINASDYVWCGNGYTPSIRNVTQGEMNVEKRQLVFHAVAFWKHKRKRAQLFCEYIEKKQGNLGIKEMIYLHKKSKCFFYQYLAMVVFQCKKLPWYEHHLQLIDFMMDIYMLLNEKYVICPIEPLQRDQGVDGNGVNYNRVFDNAQELKKRDLINDVHFCYNITSVIPVNSSELKLHDDNMNIATISKIKIILKYIKRIVL